MSKFDMDMDKAVMLDDPVIASPSGTTTIATILKLSLNTKSVNYCDPTELNFHVLEMQEMELQVVGQNCVLMEY